MPDFDLKTLVEILIVVVLLLGSACLKTLNTILLAPFRRFNTITTRYKNITTTPMFEHKRTVTMATTPTFEVLFSKGLRVVIAFLA